MRRYTIVWLLVLACSAFAEPVGVFEGHEDVGTVLHPGAAEHDDSRRIYTITGSGDNMWAASDAFHYAWRKVSGDVTLTADISILGESGDPHRKAVLMIRQSLDTDSAYVDAARHGDGLTSLQTRDAKGAASHEVQSNVSAPKRLRLAKRGPYFYMWVAGDDGVFHFSGGSMKLALSEPFYVGLGVCAHNKDAVQKVQFSNVDLAINPSSGKPTSYSTLETITVSNTDARATYVSTERIEAPIWTRDGAALLFNSNGKILRVPAAGGKAEIVDTGSAKRINSNHGISPDGTLLAFGDESKSAAVYVVSIGGGEPRKVTQKSPSYFHGWSPDGKTLLFSGKRKGKVDVYSIPSAGGEETRLTTAKGSNDNPEYSPDGKYIYFNSDRSGSMQIWRMSADGTAEEQITSDEFGAWFPRLSPNGEQLAFLSYDQSPGKDVTLRTMLLADQRIRFLARFVGGSGTIDAPAWSRDGRRLAFVSYQSIPSDSK